MYIHCMAHICAVHGIVRSNPAQAAVTDQDKAVRALPAAGLVLADGLRVEGRRKPVCLTG